MSRFIGGPPVIISRTQSPVARSCAFVGRNLSLIHIFLRRVQVPEQRQVERFKQGENVFYSGSPLKYSFDEEHQKKSLDVYKRQGSYRATSVREKQRSRRRFAIAPRKTDGRRPSWRLPKF